MNSPQYPKVLAVDFGLQRVGVAVSHASLAEPLTVLKNGPALLAQIKALCVEHQVEQVVVGVSEGEMAVKSQAFAAELGHELRLPIKLVDETLSSRSATDKLHAAGQRRRVVDDLAAAEFLQDYLDLDL